MKNNTTSDNNFKKISIQNFANQVDINVTASIKNLIISEHKSKKAKEYMSDFDHPYIIEGILILFCKGGNAKVRINLFEHLLEKNAILIVVPNSIMQLVDKNAEFDVEFIFFTFDFISGIQLTLLRNAGKKVESDPLVLLKEKVFNQLLLVHQVIVTQCQSLNPYREEAIRGYLNGMIFQVFEFYNGDYYENKMKAISRQDIIYKRFISLLFENYQKERSLNFYASKLNITPKHFSRVIKQANKLSATERIDEMVIMGAKALLKSTDLTIAQISEELNFATSSFFGTYFKKRVGMTPNRYRES